MIMYVGVGVGVCMCLRIYVLCIYLCIDVCVDLCICVPIYRLPVPLHLLSILIPGPIPPTAPTHPTPQCDDPVHHTGTYLLLP